MGAVFKGLPLLFILGWIGCAHSQKWSSLLSSWVNQPVLVLRSLEVKILWRGGSPFSSSGSDLAAYVLRSPPAKIDFSSKEYTWTQSKRRYHLINKEYKVNRNVFGFVFIQKITTTSEQNKWLDG